MKTHTLIFTTVFLITGNLLSQTFTRITTGAIVNDGGFSYGAAWGDYDNDGFIDLFVTNGGEENDFLYRNLGGGQFAKITDGEIVNDGGWSHSVSWGDYDNDGDLDIFISDSDYDNNLYSNNGDGTFHKIVEGAVIEGLYGIGSSWGDYDNDGNLDLFVATFGEDEIYHNLGDGTFERVWGALPYSWGNSSSGSWGDYDNDGDLDLFIANGYGHEDNYLYENNGDGTFTQVTSGPVVTDGGDSRGGSWGDFDNDGDLDLVVTNTGLPGDQFNFLYLNDGSGDFTQVTTGPIVTDDEDVHGSTWGDFDNDGDLDLFLTTNGGTDSYYENQGDGTFVKITSGVHVSTEGLVLGTCAGDYDRDGDLDLFCPNDYPDNLLYENNGNDNHWINVKLVGLVSNKSAIGAKVRVKAAIGGNDVWQLREISGQTGHHGQNSLNAAFGLGDATVIDSLIIEWPSGIVQDTSNVAVDQFLTIVESLEPSIAVTPDTLDFGAPYIGFPDTLAVMVANTGFGSLQLTGINVTGAGFTAISDTFSLGFGDSRAVEVALEATAVQAYSGTLTIASNDPDHPTVTVALEGQGMLPPDIVVTPDSLADTLLTGASSVHTLTIENTGDSDLEWEITLENLGLGTVTFTKENYADWTLPENQDRITDNVWITRANREGIFNAVTETDFTRSVSPEGTEWAYGFTEELESTDYEVWNYAVDGNPPNMVGKPMSVHLIENELYLDLEFHSWTCCNNGGGFSYTRSDVRPAWLSVSLDSGVVAAGGSQQVKVSIDATGLDGGGREAFIVINSNDPDEGEVTIPVHLDVTGAADIYTAIDTIDFGPVFINYADSVDLLVENKGTEDLLILSVVALPAEYTVTPAFAGINPDDTDIFQVKFAPTAVGDYPGTLTFTTTDPDEGTYVITLLGQGVEPPIVGVSPDSLIADLFTNDTLQKVLTISNTGASDLVYQVFAQAVDPGEPDAQSPRLATAVPTSMSNSVTFETLQERLEDLLPRPQPQAVKVSPAAKTAAILQSVVGNPVWHQLYTDPDEAYTDLDIRNVYGATTLDEVLFKLDTYEPLADVDGFGLFLYLDADQDTSTGLNIGDTEDIGWQLGIDYMILCWADLDSLYGVLYRVIMTPYDWDLELVDGLTTTRVDPEANEIILGVHAMHLEDFTAINLVLIAVDSGEDFVPDMGTGHITFPLSPPWLRFSTTGGVISAGGQEDVTVTFDATALFGGNYFADILVVSNDPVTPEMSVSTRLGVTGIPIYAGPDTVDFGVSYIGYMDSAYLRIDNMGTDILEITSIVSGDPQLTFVPSSISIPPFSSDTLVLYLLTDTGGGFASTISFATNDANSPDVTLPVVSSVIVAPDITVSPMEIALFLDAEDELLSDTLQIFNDGGSDLFWEINTRNIGGISVTFTKEDYADWTQPESQDLISVYVWITRADSRGIFNAATETGYSYGSPEDTEWSFGYSDDLSPWHYQNWVDAVGHNPPGMVGQPMSLHLGSEDKYYDVMFHSWTSGGNGGGFSYTRTEASPRWLTVSLASGTLPAGSAVDVIVSVDDREFLDVGDYHAEVRISSNDPDEPVVTIPVSFAKNDFREPNVLSDGGFEGQLLTDLSGLWSAHVEQIGGAIEVESGLGEARSGGNNVKITGTTDPAGWVGIDQVFGVEPYTDYLVTAYIKGDNIYWDGNPNDSRGSLGVAGWVYGEERALGLDELNDNCPGTAAEGELLFGCGDMSAWTELRYYFNSDSYSEALFWIGAFTNNGAVFRVDDISITPLHEETPVDIAEHDNNNVILSVFNNGFVGIRNGEEGTGFQFSEQNGLFEGSLVVASPYAWVVGGLYREDFSPVGMVDAIESSIPGFEQSYSATFNDQYASLPMGIEVVQRSHSKPTPPDDDYVIMDYLIFNHGDDDLTDVHVGLALDWDVGDAALNLGGFEAAQKLSYIYEEGGAANSSYYGSTLLSGEVSAHTVTFPATSRDSSYYRLIGTFRDAPTTARDCRSVLFTGPFALAVGDSVRVVFAILGGDDLADLTVNAAAAQAVWSTVVGVDPLAGLPTEFALHQNYPNPFNPTATIRYDLPTGAEATLRVYDLLGREVARLVEGYVEPGYHSITWNARDKAGRELPSGVYIARLITPEYTRSIKMLLLK